MHLINTYILHFSDVTSFEDPQEFLQYMWNSKNADGSIQVIVDSIVACKKAGECKVQNIPEGQCYEI